MLNDMLDGEVRNLKAAGGGGGMLLPPWAQRLRHEAELAATRARTAEWRHQRERDRAKRQQQEAQQVHARAQLITERLVTADKTGSLLARVQAGSLEAALGRAEHSARAQEGRKKLEAAQRHTRILQEMLAPQEQEGAGALDLAATSHVQIRRWMVPGTV
eukprot:g563.t1